MTDVKTQPEVEVQVTTKTRSVPDVKKQKLRIVLTAAGSYNDLNLKLGIFKKGDVVELENDIAKKLLSTGLFQKV